MFGWQIDEQSLNSSMLSLPMFCTIQYLPSMTPQLVLPCCHLCSIETHVSLASKPVPSK